MEDEEEEEESEEEEEEEEEPAAKPGGLPGTPWLGGCCLRWGMRTLGRAEPGAAVTRPRP
jgi:hypothetical protein